VRPLVHRQMAFIGEISDAHIALELVCCHAHRSATEGIDNF